MNLVTKFLIGPSGPFAKSLMGMSSKRFQSTGAKKTVTVLGAAGGIGQPLSMMLMLNPRVGDLRLFDVVNCPGVAADLSHIDVPTKVKGFGPGQIKEALTGSDYVIHLAGLPRKPGMTRQDLFHFNASITKDFAKSCSEFCPKALVAVIANPVNSLVPIFYEVYKNGNVDGSSTIFGVTTLDLVRANRFIGDKKNIDPLTVDCPVIGGHSGVTILPIISQCTPKVEFPMNEWDELIKRIQDAGTEVVKAKAGAGSATLSMAHSAHKFSDLILRALQGEKVSAYTYVVSQMAEAAFFATKVDIGAQGVTKIHPIGPMSDVEKNWLALCIKELNGHIREGIEFVTQNP